MNTPSNFHGAGFVMSGHPPGEPGVEGTFSTADCLGDVLLLRNQDDSIGHDTRLGLGNWQGLTNLLPADVYPSIIRGIGICKAAAAQTNFELGGFDGLRLSPDEPALPSEMVYSAIRAAAEEMIRGEHDHRFIIDVLQGGAGTSLHMNANEILAYRANEILVAHLGRDAEWPQLILPIHPNDTINDGQSTNDVIPTAARIGVLLEHRKLMDTMRLLEEALEQRADQPDFRNTAMLARTHLQDAVPITMAQVFRTYVETLRSARSFIESTSTLLQECTLGATAAGTGITSRPGYREAVVPKVNEWLAATGAGFTLEPARDYGKSTSSLFEFSAYSKALAAYAIELGKIADDIRLYASGPRGGFGELKLVPLQPGSSIMPGKVNPVMMEVLNQIATIVQGNDHTISLNAAAGQFQLNVMGPTVLWKLSESVSLLRRGLERAVDLCVQDISLNVKSAGSNLEASLVGATALKPVIGYAKAAALARYALDHDCSLEEAARSGAAGVDAPWDGAAFRVPTNGDLREFAMPPPSLGG